MEEQLSELEGSPPPMWGKGNERQGGVSRAGITPTHVGKSPCLHAAGRRHKDHPHPCGEKLKALMPLHLVSGSPPPMWEKESQ